MRSLTCLAVCAVVLVAGCSTSDPTPAASAVLPPTVTSTSVAPAEAGSELLPTQGSPEPTSTVSTSTVSTSTVSTSTVSTSTVSTTAVSTTIGPDPRFARPDWLFTRVLEPFAPGSPFGAPQPTPDVMIDRRFFTIDLLDPPPDGQYAFTIGDVPPDVVARSTFREDCPVGLDDLAYLTMSFWGFDERPHTGEMIVHRDVATEIVEIFEVLFDARFAIEEMRVMTPEDFSRPPTGDDNITSSFECRAAVGGSGGWSNHAYGLAVDINPFHNPYKKGDLVIPELASAYLDRAHERPGMILAGDVVVQAFAEIGWGWGGNWSSALDYMHFSWNSR